ncbi:MAG TPA: carboxypeptidase-like regulatory domain-containing protein [Melioribacteraceae bacterium]|nr:carboxypeptidase-like regulatory domain-containing protein [Melioribacteraceae bacterium]
MVDSTNKMKFFIPGIFLFFLLITGTVSSQNQKLTVEGKVTDGSTGEAIPLANVFLSQTTLGSSTDKNGYFKIQNVPLSLFSLVVSVIGYETRIVSVDFRDGKNKYVDIKLQPTVYLLEEVSVKDEADENWENQFQRFKKIFFGNNDFAKHCEIKNPYHINFREDGNKLFAEASTPIMIINKALGYDIECILNYFEYNKSDGSVSYSVFPLFNAVKTTDEDSLEYFITNREKAYFGSTIHLLSSLAQGRYRFRDEGFELRRGSKIVNKAEEIVEHHPKTNRYFLNFNNCINIEYWNNGTRTYSVLCLNYGSTEFSSDGYFLALGEFSISGEMAKEGVATLLPRFVEVNE